MKTMRPQSAIVAYVNRLRLMRVGPAAHQARCRSVAVKAKHRLSVKAELLPFPAPTWRPRSPKRASTTVFLTLHCVHYLLLVLARYGSMLSFLGTSTYSGKQS